MPSLTIHALCDRLADQWLDGTDDRGMERVGVSRNGIQIGTRWGGLTGARSWQQAYFAGLQTP